MLDVIISYDFIRYALLIGVFIGFLAPVLGVFIVVRRQTLIADALSHITLTGIAFHLFLAQFVNVLYSFNPVWMGMGFAVTGSLIMEKLRHVYTAYKEMAIPIILSTGIGLGVVFLSLADGFNNDLFQYLFGSMIAVSKTDVWTIGSLTVIVTVLLILFYKELFVLSFDEEYAEASGIPDKMVNFIFAFITALVIAMSMRIVGILLVSSLIILPVAAAIQVAQSFRHTFLYSILYGEAAVLSGMILSFYLDIAPGGTIAMIALILLLLTLVVKKYKLQ